jgi:hypothetical protein
MLIRRVSSPGWARLCFRRLCELAQGLLYRYHAISMMPVTERSMDISYYDDHVAVDEGVTIVRPAVATFGVRCV